MKKGYLEMDEATRMALLENVEDIITPEVEKRNKFLRGISCPSCGNDDCIPTTDADRPFTSAEMLPKQMLVCSNCDANFEPYTRIQVNAQRVPRDVMEVAKAFIKV
jgi:C4-type Zn-finger protein